MFFATLSHILPSVIATAFSTCSHFIFIYVGVFFIERVPIHAFGFSAVNCGGAIASKDVNFSGNVLKMIRVNTFRILTKVIYVHFSTWLDRSLIKLKRKTVGTYGAFTVKELAIPVTQPAEPHPTCFRFLNFFEKSRFNVFHEFATINTGVAN